MVLGIRAIKLYAWEAPFVARILGLRDAELQCVRHLQLLFITNNSISLGVCTSFELYHFPVPDAW